MNENIHCQTKGPSNPPPWLTCQWQTSIEECKCREAPSCTCTVISLCFLHLQDVQGTGDSSAVRHPGRIYLPIIFLITEWETPWPQAPAVMCSDFHAQHKYLLMSVPTHSFILSGSHTMRNHEESFPSHTCSAPMFCRPFSHTTSAVSLQAKEP